MQSNLIARRRRLAKRRHSARAKSAMPALLISPPQQQQPKSLADFAWDYYCQTWRKEDPQSYLAYLLAIKIAQTGRASKNWLLDAITLAALAKGASRVFDDN
jgi:hypothetical protein